MVSTAKHDQGNLPTDHECDVVQDAQGKTLLNVQEPIALKAQMLTREVAQPGEDKEERREVALRASTAPPGSIATFARPKDHATLTGMDIYDSDGDSESSDENSRRSIQPLRRATTAPRIAYL